MAKKTPKKGKAKAGEQLDLIDVGPKNLKEILAAVLVYKDYLKNRLAFLKKEIAQKAVVLRLARKSKLKRLDDGKISFSCGGYLVEVEPRDEVIRIKRAKPEKKKKNDEAARS